MSLYPADTLGEYIERINGDPAKRPHYCMICGEPSSCSTPGACRSQARFEDDPGHAGEFVGVEEEEENDGSRDEVDF